MLHDFSAAASTTNKKEEMASYVTEASYDKLSVDEWETALKDESLFFRTATSFSLVLSGKQISDQGAAALSVALLAHTDLTSLT